MDPESGLPPLGAPLGPPLAPEGLLREEGEQQEDEDNLKNTTRDGRAGLNSSTIHIPVTITCPPGDTTIIPSQYSLSVCQSVFLTVSLSVSLYLSLGLPLSLSVSLSLCLSDALCHPCLSLSPSF